MRRRTRTKLRHPGRPPSQRRGPNYVAKVIGGARAGLAAGTIRRGELTQALIAHDDWCRMLNNQGPCNCNPEIRLESLDDPARN